MRIAAGGFMCLLFAPLAPAQNWSDVEGRIQYAYYTEDTRALKGVLNSLETKPVEGDDAESSADAGMRAYFRALAHYRMAQVSAAGKKSRAGDSIDECGEEVDQVVDALPRVLAGLDESPQARLQRAEAYALGTACSLAGRELTALSLLGGRVSSRIEEAVKLEPRNPRVRLVEALVAFGRAGKDVAERDAALKKLQEVTILFEAARTAQSTTPEWGAAEAYAYLGRALFDQRDVVGAREALERALLMAPEYAYARRVMAQITR